MLKQRKYTILWGLWVVAVVTLSLVSGKEMPEAPCIPYLDKIVHFGFYFGYTVLFILTFWKENQWITNAKKCYIWAFISAFFIGATMEILQGTLTTTRSADPIDMLFNTFGIIVALLFMTRYKELFR
jgi:hypothetical protein